ncbi:MAG: SPFH domain-containing protein, partial [Terriglobales bacterium]
MLPTPSAEHTFKKWRRFNEAAGVGEAFVGARISAAHYSAKRAASFVWENSYSIQPLLTGNPGNKRRNFMNTYDRDRVIDFNSFPIGKMILGGFIALVLVIAAFSTFTTIPAGNVGVLTLFGRVTGEKLDSGFSLINPLKKVVEMTVRTQSLKESADVPSSEGLVMGLDTSLVFKLDPEKAAQVYR